MTGGRQSRRRRLDDLNRKSEVRKGFYISGALLRLPTRHFRAAGSPVFREFTPLKHLRSAWRGVNMLAK